MGQSVKKLNACLETIMQRTGQPRARLSAEAGVIHWYACHRIKKYSFPSCFILRIVLLAASRLFPALNETSALLSVLRASAFFRPVPYTISIF
jgi:hypothetical protein